MKTGYCLDYCLSYLVPLCQRILNLKDIEELVVESTAIGVMYKIAEHWKNLFEPLVHKQTIRFEVKCITPPPDCLPLFQEHTVPQKHQLTIGSRMHATNLQTTLEFTDISSALVSIMSSEIAYILIFCFLAIYLHRTLIQLRFRVLQRTLFWGVYGM